MLVVPPAVLSKLEIVNDGFSGAGSAGLAGHIPCPPTHLLSHCVSLMVSFSLPLAAVTVTPTCLPQ